MNRMLYMLLLLILGCSEENNYQPEIEKELVQLPEKSIEISKGYPFDTESYIFNTSFSGIHLDSESGIFSGVDNIFKSNNSIENIQAHLKIFYENTNTDKAIAKISDDPTNNSKKALHFNIKDTNANNKSRVQLDFYTNRSFLDISSQVDIFLPSTMSYLKNYDDAIRWLTIQEYWNNAVQEDYIFRLTLGMLKDKNIGNNLYFDISTEDITYDKNEKPIFTRVDNFTDNSWPIPFGEWFTLKTEIKEGDSKNGRFILTAQKESDSEPTVIFNHTIYTHSTLDPNPSGINKHQPMKLYTSSQLTNFMKEQRKELDIYFKNWIFKGTSKKVYTGTN